jgi:hypothetical protein
MLVPSLLISNETRIENRKLRLSEVILTVEEEKELICVGHLKR